MKKLLSPLAITLLASPLISFAISDNAPFKLSGKVLGGDGKDVVSLMTAVINWIFTILLILAVIYILMAAFRYMTSQGSPEKISQANKMLIYALVAVAVAFLAEGLIFVVKQLVAPNAPALNGSAPFND